MSAGGWAMAGAMVVSLGALLFVIASMARSIRNEHTAGHSIWREFSLGLALMVLFFVSWVTQGIAEWQTYTDEQHAHNQPVEVGDFVSEFAQSTLENWQSEFLQLFAFVVLAALYVHKGSAESKDTDEKVEASLRRIEARLGTLPDDAPRGDKSSELPHPEAVASADSAEIQLDDHEPEDHVEIGEIHGIDDGVEVRDTAALHGEGDRGDDAAVT